MSSRCCSAASAAWSGSCFPAAIWKRSDVHDFGSVILGATSPLVGEVESHRGCDPGEGFRSIDRPEPLTRTLSHKGRGGSPPLCGYRVISIQMDTDSSDAASSLAYLFDARGIRRSVVRAGAA